MKKHLNIAVFFTMSTKTKRGETKMKNSRRVPSSMFLSPLIVVILFGGCGNKKESNDAETEVPTGDAVDVPSDELIDDENIDVQQEESSDGDGRTEEVSWDDSTEADVIDMQEEDISSEDNIDEDIEVGVCTGQPNFTPCDVVTAPDRDYDICISGDCRSPGCGGVQCNPPGPHFQLPDTNQRSCYSSSSGIACPGTPGDPSCASTGWCGQDAQYGWDAEGHAPSERFTRNGTTEPVVLDNVSGLEWQGCAAGLGDINCSTGSSTQMNWEEAIAYCDALTWDGHDDWHLPDRHELQSIVDYGRVNPTIDISAFPETITTMITYWSLSDSNYSTVTAWAVEFLRGRVRIYGKVNGLLVRCVRFGQPAVERFTRTGSDQPVVTDNVTGLIWQGCPAGSSGSDCSASSYITQNWQEALAYCEELSWAGHDDWRLPDIKEMASIVDDHEYEPSIDESAFPGTPSQDFWSSSTYSYTPSYSYNVSFSVGEVTYGGKNNPLPFRCVRFGS